eukprot:m.14711 g.14711  ORF g.14711 m.14711 type:complete len:177 (+) comp6498_c0_seq1:203-733(+)
MAADLVIAVVGVGGVGKTSAIVRYIKGEFSEEYNPTIGDNFQKKITIERVKVKVEFLDTAGQQEFKLYRDAQIGNAHAYLVVYAIDNARSFEEAKEIISTLDASKTIRLIGNKADLAAARQVPQADAKAYCDSKNIAFGECSAKLGDSVAANVEGLVRDAMQTIVFRDRRQSCVIA